MMQKNTRWSWATLLAFRGKVRPKPLLQPRSENLYHAVSIIPGAKACGAVFRFAGKRYLSRNAPVLPLPTCDVAHCTCTFKHHKDRRAGPRRNSDIGVATALWNGTERRRRIGRRASDKI